MEFSLIHAGLAAGAALAVVPVILHLFMRQTPRHVVFPALRLVRERQKRSRKRLRIKNWLLLLARMAVVALMAFALARPRLYSQMPLGDESVPVALGLVFDTSLSMGYRERDQTRLEEAKERALGILRQIPESSLVFVVDSADPGIPVGLSPAAARKRIETIALRPVNRPLNLAMGQVYPAVAECDRPRREVYVLTDLSRGSWNLDRPAEGLDRLEQLKATPGGGNVATFILNLGVNDATDVSIEAAEPSAVVATQGEPIEIRGRIRAHGSAPASRVVEFYLDGDKKGFKQVEIPAGGQVEVSFITPPRLKEGEIHRGELRLSGAPDPLDFNDRRFFTFKVRPALKVLLISDLAIDADYVAAALEPEPNPAAPRTFQIDRVRPAELVPRYRESLRSYAAVFLLNVESLDEAAWGLLNAYVHAGGGLVIGLGDRCQTENYMGTTSSQVVPVVLKEVRAAGGELSFGAIADPTHPLFERYAPELEPMLAQISVYRYWVVEPREGSRVLLTFADGAAALIERAFKGSATGRVLLWTTPLARRPRRTDRGAWNEFPLPSLGWSFLALMNRTVSYLAGDSGEELNFQAGENVLLPLESGVRYQDFLVTSPDGKTTERLSPSSGSEYLEIIAPQALGQWTVLGITADGARKPMGFSLNPPRAESVLDPLEPAELDRIFGKDGYALAQDVKELKRLTEMTRVGYEIFPWLMMAILLLVTLENLLANTFYREIARPRAEGAAA